VTRPLTLKVQEGGTSGYLVEWRQGRSVVEGQSGSNPLVDKVLGLTENTSLLLELSPDGRLLGLRNWEDVRAMALAMLDVVHQRASQANQRIHGAYIATGGRRADASIPSRPWKRL
jgi:hypothetical protein